MVYLTILDHIPTHILIVQMGYSVHCVLLSWHAIVNNKCCIEWCQGWTTNPVTLLGEWCQS
jgi:hypothetical protein